MRKHLYLLVSIIAIMLYVSCHSSKTEDVFMKHFGKSIVYTNNQQKKLAIIALDQYGCAACYKQMKSYIENADNINSNLHVLLVGKNNNTSENLDYLKVFDNRIIYDNENIFRSIETGVFSTGILCIENGKLTDSEEYAASRDKNYAELFVKKFLKKHDLN